MKVLRSLTGNVIVILLLLVATGCAMPPQQVRIDSDPAVDLRSYRTFAFLEPLSTDRAGYSTLLSSRLRTVTYRELQRRGYVYAEANPQLLVNFQVNLQPRQEVRTVPTAGCSFYCYRLGLYDPWPGYPYDIATVNYVVGTLAIDFVDAARKQLVWQGVTEGRVTAQMLNDPEPAIERAVTILLRRVPPAANAVRAR